MGSNVPNLDVMDRGELMEFWLKYHSGAQYNVLFPQGGKGTIRATRELSNYAANRAAAILCRETGNIAQGCMYDRICDLIYRELSAFARW